MMRQIIFTILLAIFLVGTTTAQFADKAELESTQKDHLGLNPVDKPFSLIDLSRLQWSHSYSFSFVSGSGYSGSMGMYTGNIFYEFSQSLSLSLRLSIAHNPEALFNQTMGTNAQFYPGLRLDYHPSDKFHISVGFESYPGVYYNPYYNYDRNYLLRKSTE